MYISLIKVRNVLENIVDIIISTDTKNVIKMTKRLIFEYIASLLAIHIPSGADRRRSNYIWLINKLIAY